MAGQHSDIDHTGLTGVGVASATFNDHSARHENGGADEISLAGLDGTPTELTNHLGDAADAHDASAISFTPAGTIAATDVQAAIEEVASEAGAAAASELLALKVYGTEGVSAGSWGTSSATQADVDATNAAVTFTAPASGKVLVRVTALMRVDTLAKGGYLGLRESTTDLITKEIVLLPNTAGLPYATISRTFYLSGISAGSHTYKLAFAVDTVATFSIFYGNGNGPLTIEVWAAP